MEPDPNDSQPETPKLSKAEEEYLDKLMNEKKIVDVTAGLDFTQKLINAGK